MRERADLLALQIGLNAAIVAVADGEPRVLVTSRDAGTPADGLPSGPFDPLSHRTFETGLRAFAEAQTGLALGYVEQLYTFGDRGRLVMPGDAVPHVISVGYLALTRIADEDAPATGAAGSAWRPIHRYFPWEDWRSGRPAIIGEIILPALEAWARKPVDDAGHASAPSRRDRLHLAFGHDGIVFDEERVLDRYELLYEAGLVEEAVRDRRFASVAAPRPLGLAMQFDHRRILATALARLRSKLKYRPVIFELLRPEFTLTELQGVVEAIAGRLLHKQNFRRFVTDTTGLVEPIGQVSAATGGRPAALFRFRQEVLKERPAPGIRLGRG